jgi:hypothetical protein
MSAEVQTTQSAPHEVDRDRGWLDYSTEILSRHSRWIAALVVTSGFFWRVWLAHATFFNTDEAWHFSVANQDSLLAAYRGSLTLAHPPLLVFVLYFWKHLGTSDLMIRMPCVIAGTLFCFVFYRWLKELLGPRTAWVGLILVMFLPPLIALSADLRQYTLLLMFSVTAAYFLERALAEYSAPLMLLSSLCLYLAMLSHYSAFLFAASLGVYAILRMFSKLPPTSVIACWGCGQLGGLVLACLLYVTHIAKLGVVYAGAQPLHRFGDFYIADWYFHPGRDRLLPFLYKGTFGLFRFVFGQTAMAQIAVLLFIAGIILLLRQPAASDDLPPPRTTAFLLLAPFILNWIAVVAGLYPYGRTRQCVFLAVFALAGVSFALVKVARNKTAFALVLAVATVAICQAFGALQGRDMLPLAEQRHEHMDRALDFIRSHVTPDDLIFVDEATSFQLRHYLCRQQPAKAERPVEGFESYRCDGLRIISTAPRDRTLTPDAPNPVPEFRNTLLAQWQNLERSRDLKPGASVWVVQAGWGSGLGESLKSDFPQFSQIAPRSFGRYINVFKLPAVSS